MDHVLFVIVLQEEVNTCISCSLNGSASATPPSQLIGQMERGRELPVLLLTFGSKDVTPQRRPFQTYCCHQTWHHLFVSLETFFIFILLFSHSSFTFSLTVTFPPTCRSPPDHSVALTYGTLPWAPPPTPSTSAVPGHISGPSLAPQSVHATLSCRHQPPLLTCYTSKHDSAQPLGLDVPRATIGAAMTTGRLG